MIGRRAFLCLGSALTASAMVLASPRGFGAIPQAPAFAAAGDWRAQLATLERTGRGRLGVALLDSADGRRFAWRGDERFTMCSTFKFLLAGAVLQQCDRGVLDLQRRVPIAVADLLGNAPISEQNVGRHGLSIAELCEAAMIWSDNTAANLLLPLVGGPAGLTGFVRTLGDEVTRSDRNEPALNESAPGDLRDTTTPLAMASNLRQLLLGDALSVSSRRRLADWMIDNRTGGARLRAGLPTGWKAGDKTGSDGRHITNDIAILWPPGGRAPLLLAVYLAEASGGDQERNAMLKAVAEIITKRGAA